MGMGYIVALIMKQKDWAAEFKHITDIMSELAMSKGYISRFEKRYLLNTDICMPLFDCHTQVLFQMPTERLGS